MNLLSNALKFTPADGYIKVNIARIEKDGQPFYPLKSAILAKAFPKNKWIACSIAITRLNPEPAVPVLVGHC